jgi:hypothetical protein
MINAGPGVVLNDLLRGQRTRPIRTADYGVGTLSEPQRFRRSTIG